MAQKRCGMKNNTSNPEALPGDRTQPENDSPGNRSIAFFGHQITLTCLKNRESNMML